MKRATDSWNKIRDLRHTAIQYLLQQNRFGTGEAETIQREKDVRRHVGGMPLLTDLSLAMRTDPFALIRGATSFVTVIYGPAVTFAFPDVKVEAYRRSMLHLNLKSAVDGSALNWCEQHVLRELMSEDLLFAKISEPEMTVVNFDDHFRDRIVQSYGTQSILKLGLNRPLMREVLDKLDECEGRLSDLLIDSATDESEANSPIKMTLQEDKGEVVYLS